MRKFTLLATILLCTFFQSFSADIYTYVAASTAGAPSYTDPNLATASNLTAIGTGSSTACAQGFSGITGFTGVSYSPAGACIQISLTAIPGYTINATGFTTHIRNSSTGPAMVRLAYSTDGGLSWIDDGVDYTSFTGSCATSTAGTNFIDWSPLTVTNTSILFRVYPFAAPGSGGTVQIYDLDIIAPLRHFARYHPPSPPHPALLTVAQAAWALRLPQPVQAQAAPIYGRHLPVFLQSLVPLS